MASWTDIANALVAVGAKPFASTLQALRDNIIALAEQAAGAPKIKQVNTASGTAAITQTFTGLGDYEGVEFAIAANRNGGAGTFNHTLEYSTNGGSTWSATFTLVATSGNPFRFYGEGAFNFATGDVVFVGSRSDADGSLRAAGTIAGASLAIDALRFSFANGVGAVIIRPKGATA